LLSRHRRAEFLEPLKIRPVKSRVVHADAGTWANGLVYFAIIRYSAFAHVDTSVDAGAPSEALFAGVVEAFRVAARFLDQRPPSITAAMRAQGLSLQVFLDVRMVQDQMQLEAPEILAACGRHGLGVYAISNDIPAAEVLEARGPMS